MPESQPIGTNNILIPTHGFHQNLPVVTPQTQIPAKPKERLPNSTFRIDIQHQLEIKPNRKILVPGCEPTSALSSTTLSSYLAEGGCGNALVDLDVALEAIPGSVVKLADNYGRAGTTQKWFVLPAIGTNCPCQSYDDYYNILRELADEEVEEQESFDSCNVIGMGYCPSPDFDSALPPPTSPYKEEGSFPADAGVLPPIPPWGRSGT